jgi:hypothetical protein
VWWVIAAALLVIGCVAATDAPPGAAGVAAATATSPTLAAPAREAASETRTSVTAGDVEPRGSPVRSHGTDVGPWERALDRLARIRSRAFVQARPALLRRVYVSPSALLRRERCLLRGYADRGVQLRGARLHTSAVRVLSRSGHTITLEVVERLGRTTALVGHRRVPLPADAPTQRILRLVRSGTGWRLASAHRMAG